MISKKIAAMFLESHLSLFAPILYNQSLIDYFPKIELESRRGLLMPMNMDFLLKSKAMILLKLQGWDASWGIGEYIKTCKREDIQVYEIHEESLEKELVSLISKLSVKTAAIY